jgi:hypothetical protein
VSEDENRDETEVEAHAGHGNRHALRNDEPADEADVEAHAGHGNRHALRNDEPADEERRAEGDQGDDDEVEAHMRRSL